MKNLSRTPHDDQPAASRRVAVRTWRSLLVALTWALAPGSASAQTPVEFTGIFAPTEHFVPAPEQPLRQDLCLNGRWQFQPVPVPGTFQPGSGNPPPLTAPDPQRWEPTPIKIPSPWNVNVWGNGSDVGDGTKHPYVADSVYFPSYPPRWDGVQMGWLRRTFRVPPDWQGRRLILRFEAVAGEAQVVVNGQVVGSHFDSFLPFEFDVTRFVHPDGDNELLVGVRKSELFNVVSPDYPKTQSRTYPNGSNMDHLVGIWNDVFLVAVPPVRVEEVFIQPQVAENALTADITLRNDGSEPRKVRITGKVSPWVNLAGQDTLSAPVPKWRLDAPVLTLPTQEVLIPPGDTVAFARQTTVDGKLKPWSPTAPNLYGLTLEITDADGHPLDRKYTRFGWREFKLHGRELLLNGQPLQLFGDFCHPFGPFIGSRRYVWADYRMIKDFGGNAVRPHAQPMPRFWLDLADEMGLCVLDETAVFGSSISLNLREPVTWERLERHVDGLVLRDRNHPSVFGWSPANEMFALSLHTTPADKEAATAKLKALAQRPRRLDSTHEWISVDGDKDLDGTLPVWSSHHGIGIPDDLPATDKPRLIGEHGGTYYADPVQLRQLNGDRAFQSYAGRDEALGIDLYQMVVKCAKPELTAFSPSELVWFGLEHLPFGYRTDERPPNKRDGIFFPHYAEDTPGVQIERLPPYVATLNPGFDPTLPLYKPLAMFDALKAALDPRGPQPCPWDHAPGDTPAPPQPAPTDKILQVGFAGDPNTPLFRRLSALGVPLVAEEKAADCPLLIVAAATLHASDAETVTHLADHVSASGGLVWVMFRDHSTPLSPLAGLLRGDLSLTDRRASSLVHASHAPSTDPFTLTNLYFANEEADPYIQKAGLDGPLVQTGRTLLTAADTDWSLFERQGESRKCSSVLIYEHVRKPAGASLVELPRGRGRLWLSTLDAARSTPGSDRFWAQLFRNVGVKLTAAKPVSPDEKAKHDLLLDGPPQ